MPALLIADIDVRDPGAWVPRRTVVIEFPDMAALQASHDSPEYAQVRGIRWRSADSRLVGLETTAFA